jgi:hypothetical protein
MRSASSFRLNCDYGLVPVVVLVGLPLPQPTTEMTLMARTRATITRFIESSSVNVATWVNRENQADSGLA